MSLVVAASMALGATGASARIIDFTSKPHPVLDVLAPALDQFGIDVVRDARIGVLPASRPRVMDLTPLYRTGANAVTSRRFADEFTRGAVGVLTAGKAEGVRAREQRRVFISFTRADLAYANRVKAALEREGYSVFVYLNGTEGPLLHTAAEVGRQFARADHHFVIDTHAARRSEGVWVEARATRFFRHRDGGAFGTIAPNRGPNPPPSDAGGPGREDDDDAERLIQKMLKNRCP